MTCASSITRPFLTIGKIILPRRVGRVKHVIGGTVEKAGYHQDGPSWVECGVRGRMSGLPTRGDDRGSPVAAIGAGDDVLCRPAVAAADLAADQGMKRRPTPRYFGRSITISASREAQSSR